MSRLQRELEAVTLNGGSAPSDGVGLVISDHQGQQLQEARRRRRGFAVGLALVAVGVLVALVAGSAYRCALGGCWQRGAGSSAGAGTSTQLHTPALVSRIAFGSCTAYDARYQEIWTEGIIPAEPDAWCAAAALARRGRGAPCPPNWPEEQRGRRRRGATARSAAAPLQGMARRHVLCG